MKLYLVVLGGSMKGSHIEMHDVRWVVGNTIESTLPKLKSEWIGNTKGLHIDSYKLIKFVNGYQINLVKNNETDINESKRLWFINLGGYKDGEMLEQHHIELTVASTAQAAKQKTCEKWSGSMNDVHKDNHSSIVQLQDYSILLRPDPLNRDDGMQPDWSGYWVIG